VRFYYPKLGNLTDVTLAVFHVADFQLVTEGDRIGSAISADPVDLHRSTNIHTLSFTVEMWAACPAQRRAPL